MAKKKNAVRKDGRIAVQVYLGMVDCKRKYKTVYGLTQREADEKALQVKLSMRKGLDVTSERDTFGDWANRWIQMKKQEVCHKRGVIYESNIKHLNSNLEFAQITKIRTADIQEIFTQLSINNPNKNRPMSHATLVGLKGVAFQIFQYAVDNRVMDYNPVRAVKIPKVKKQNQRRALTDEEQNWILETEHHAKRAAMIMMYAGLRRGELVPLTWNDIDLDARTISINKTVEAIDSKFFIKDTAKTDAGIRTVDIPQRLVDFLRNENRESMYVCVSEKNQVYTPTSWNRMWDKYLETLNLKYGDFSAFESNIKSKYDSGEVPFVIPRITAHWLRHTFASILYMAGVDMLTAKEQLGHADIKTTLEIYTHLDAVHKRKAMNKLDAYLDNANTMQVKHS